MRYSGRLSIVFLILAVNVVGKIKAAMEMLCKLLSVKGQYVSSQSRK